MHQRVAVAFRGGGQQEARAFSRARVPACCACPASPPSSVSIGCSQVVLGAGRRGHDARRSRPGPRCSNGRVTSCSAESEARVAAQVGQVGRPSRSGNCPAPITAWPSASSRSQRCEPMKPAAPETTMRNSLLRLIVSGRPMCMLHRIALWRNASFGSKALLLAAADRRLGRPLLARASGKVVGRSCAVAPRRRISDCARSARACASSSGRCCCQAKVIRERPLPGLAHAFVFWGFCAFALVTLNHVAAGRSASACCRRKAGSAASTSASSAVFAVAVAVSIAGLLRAPLLRAAEVAGRAALAPNPASSRS